MNTTISHLPQVPLSASIRNTYEILSAPAAKTTPEGKKGEKECFNMYFTLFNAAFLLVLFLLLPLVAVTGTGQSGKMASPAEQVLLKDNIFYLKSLDFLPEDQGKHLTENILQHLPKQ